MEVKLDMAKSGHHSTESISLDFNAELQALWKE